MMNSSKGSSPSLPAGAIALNGEHDVATPMPSNRMLRDVIDKELNVLKEDIHRNLQETMVWKAANAAEVKLLLEQKITIASQGTSLSTLPDVVTADGVTDEEDSSSITTHSPEASAPGSHLIPSNYLELGMQAHASIQKRFTILLRESKWQKKGWDDLTIGIFLQYLASMDSNNFISKIGVGEREARIFSSLVQKRHYGFCHGIGRSGDLGEAQPKAVGSSLMSALVNKLVLDMCRKMISPKVSAAFLSPMATGMSLALVLLALKKEKPGAKYVIWSRIDQKSCFKSILTAGLEPLIIHHRLEGDELRTEVNDIKRYMDAYGVANVLCVLTTSSCFAPRASDSLEEVSKFCLEQDVFHVVNNAYGLQSTYCCHQISAAAREGRVDVFVQSTDKNLMVPVGGAIIAGYNAALVQKIQESYPGRASSSQTIDVLITLLSMGSETYMGLVKKTKENFFILNLRLNVLAHELGERVLSTPHNKISVGMTLGKIGQHLEPAARSKVLTKLGSMLFKRHVGGCRVVTGLEVKEIEGNTFPGWGAHHNAYPTPYLTAAATIGMEAGDIDDFIKKLEVCYKKISNALGKSEVLDGNLGDLK